MKKTVEWYLVKGFSQKMAEYFASGRHKIIGVVPNPDFTLILTFDNDEKRVFDMKPIIQPKTVFEYLSNWDIFSKVYLDSELNVSWDKNPNIDSEIDWSNKIDLSTDSLYVDSIPLRRELNL